MSEFLEGTILLCTGGRYSVLSGGKRYSCYAKGSLRHDGIKPLCGDRVRFVPGAHFDDDGSPLPPSKENDGFLTEVLERKTVLRRPPIANLNTLLIFTAAADPAPDLLYLDRLSVCAVLAGIEPIIICNKRELAPDVAESIVNTYRKAGFCAFSLSAKEGATEQLSQLSAHLRGKTSAMAGFSGVGKTTFFNLLFPHEKGEVGALSEKLSRGKNTTRTTELHSLLRSTLKTEGLFADTAGFSRLELDQIDTLIADNLPFYFPEFVPLLGTCRFSKCSHKSELGCAIRHAVDQGQIPESRYNSFLALCEELKQ